MDISKLPAHIANRLYTFDLDKIEGLYAKLPAELKGEYCALILWLNLPLERRAIAAELQGMPIDYAPSPPGPSPQERWEDMADKQHMSEMQDKLDAQWLMGDENEDN